MKSELKKHQFEAFLGNYMNFWSYIRSYQNAFDVLMKEVKESSLHVDRFAYPMLFMARHCIELGFKANIRYFSKYSEKQDFTNSDSHDLKMLFGGFKLHFKETLQKLKEKYGVEVDPDHLKSFDNYCKKVNDLVDVFDLMDKGSFNFRYPVDKKNNSVFKPGDRINLLDVKELLDETIILLFHTSDVFSLYTDYADEIERMYEEELKASYGTHY